LKVISMTVPFFILLDLRADGRGTTVCARFVGTPAKRGGHGPCWASHWTY
jgi:hypothetical protein